MLTVQNKGTSGRTSLSMRYCLPLTHTITATPAPPALPPPCPLRPCPRPPPSLLNSIFVFFSST